MFGTDGLLGEWLDFFREEDGALVLDLSGTEFPWGLGRVRTFGRVRIAAGSPPVPLRAEVTPRRGRRESRG